MATYENCYEILANVRQGLNEYSTALLQGTDATGAYLNSFLIKAINRSVRHIYGLLLMRMPEIFYESIDLVGVNSVFTLPWDFGRCLYFKDENGLQVFRINPKQLKLANETGNDRLYYQSGQTFVLDKDGVTKTYTLQYYRKPREIHAGKASTGGSKSITLDAAFAKKIADYYNGMLYENVTKDHIDTITDYTAARVATIAAETAAENDYYGIVSDIPEPFHHLIAPKAVHLIKNDSPVAQEKPTSQSLDEWTANLSEAIQSYSGSDDGDVEDLFLDFD